MKTPITKAIKGHPNYIIDENGKVWNQLTHQRVKEYINPNGFSYVVLDGYWKTIAYLMKAAFFTDDCNMCIRHKDGDRTNNKLSNLYTWFGGSETLDQEGNERKILIMEVNPQTNEVIRFWGSVKEIADDLGLSESYTRLQVKSHRTVNGRKFEQYRSDTADMGLFDYSDGKRKIKVFDECNRLVGVAKSYTEAAKWVGMSSGALRHAVEEGRSTQKGYHFEWDLSTTEVEEETKVEKSNKVKEEKPRPPKKERKSTARPVTQYDRKGNIIKEWESVTKAAEATNITDGNIRASLNGVSTHAGGFVWRWKDEPFYKYSVTPSTPEPSREVKEKPKRDPSTYKRDTQFTIGKRVCQYDMEGNIIKEWESASRAAQTLGINLALLGRAAKGKVKSAGGYYWGYAGEPFNIHSRRVSHSSLKKPLYQLTEAPDGNGWTIVNEWDGVNEAARELGHPAASLSLCAKEPHKYKDGYWYSYTPDMK